jgi:competence protein ComEA
LHESRFAKPVARVALCAAGLVGLAVIGHFAARGELGALAAPAIESGRADNAAAPYANAEKSRDFPAHEVAATQGASATSVEQTMLVSSEVASSDPIGAHRAASAEDPVVLNSATVDDLRRLPGIGEKRATAILQLRAHLGRFRVLEDLLKVKGIGRATLKRLRPLVRLDAKPLSDAGVH